LDEFASAEMVEFWQFTAARRDSKRISGKFALKLAEDCRRQGNASPRFFARWMERKTRM
jgi:hypothetical protein